MIGSSVYYVRSGGMRNVPVTKALEHLYATTAKFSGCVILASRPAYSSYPPRRKFLETDKMSQRSDLLKRRRNRAAAQRQISEEEKNKKGFDFLKYHFNFNMVPINYPST
ncbi:hypothetical protein AVEN_189936-1 [Araneus ventricosus]|uniref:Uncharacterized protein n=1 Tax=Araneus ventricosus TaxID=182803 RepID=A0A4Y2F543_ARAVE|nr:hypothetical protein AVEN_189936-1 [Araneus ventricosus]